MYINIIELLKNVHYYCILNFTTLQQKTLQLLVAVQFRLKINKSKTNHIQTNDFDNVLENIAIFCGKLLRKLQKRSFQKALCINVT